MASTACTTYLRPAAKRDCCDVSPYLSVIYATDRRVSGVVVRLLCVGDRQQRADEFAPKKYVCRTNRKRVGNPQESNKEAANDATSRRDGCGVLLSAGTAAVETREARRKTGRESPRHFPKSIKPFDKAETTTENKQARRQQPSGKSLLLYPTLCSLSLPPSSPKILCPCCSSALAAVRPHL